jgi:hypothetical protein
MKASPIPALAILHGVIYCSLALLADAEDLSGMSDISESMFFRDFLRPFFNGAAFDFNGLTATLTDKVMMMALATKAINCFAIITPQYIDNLLIDQTL